MEFNKLYLTVVSVPEPVVSEIKRFKASCRQMINTKFSSYGAKAHITIRKEHPERPSVMYRKAMRLKSELQSIPTVKLKINGFGYFENGADKFVIYAKVEADDFVNRWWVNLKTCCNNKERGLMHITIARELTAREFNVLWPYFKEQPYQRSFIADNITILEKEMLSDDHSKIFANLSLGHRNVVLPQAGTLFNAPVYIG